MDDLNSKLKQTLLEKIHNETNLSIAEREKAELTQAGKGKIGAGAGPIRKPAEEKVEYWGRADYTEEQGSCGVAKAARHVDKRC